VFRLRLPQKLRGLPGNLARVFHGKVAGVLGVFSEAVEVACSPAGQPVRLVWGNRTYRIVAEPVRWYQRRSWWAEEQRAELGRGAGLVDHEIWRVQVRLGERSQVRTLDLSRQGNPGRWRLIKVHDAIQSMTA
jgi:hypothetical protein